MKLEQFVEGPTAALGLHRAGIVEARHRVAGAADHAIKRRADLVDLGAAGVVALLALAEMALPLAASAAGSTVPQSGIASSAGGGGAAAGGFFNHALDDIAGLGGFFRLIDDLGRHLDDQDEQHAAQDRANDLVPLKGIHAGLLPKPVLTSGPAAGEYGATLPRPPRPVIAAKRRIKSLVSVWRPYT